MHTTTEFSKFRLDDGITTITFDRPDNLNAFIRGMVAELVGLLEQVDGDDCARALILTGGGGAFGSGTDLNASDPLLSSRRGALGDAESIPHGLLMDT